MPEQMWAEPDVADAARWMRRLAADEALLVGAWLGLRESAEPFSPASVGMTMRSSSPV